MRCQSNDDQLTMIWKQQKGSSRDDDSLDKFWCSYRSYSIFTLAPLAAASYSGLELADDGVRSASFFFFHTGIFLAGLLGFVVGNWIQRRRLRYCRETILDSKSSLHYTPGERNGKLRKLTPVPPKG